MPWQVGPCISATLSLYVTPMQPIHVRQASVPVIYLCTPVAVEVEVDNSLSQLKLYTVGHKTLQRNLLTIISQSGNPV